MPGAKNCYEVLFVIDWAVVCERVGRTFGAIGNCFTLCVVYIKLCTLWKFLCQS